MGIERIELTQGLHAIVDAEDYAWLSAHKWCASYCHRGKAVAVRGLYVGGKRSIIFMHREILGLVPGDSLEGDHRNHDTLDNRRANLRVLTPAANKRHQPSRGGSSRFVGVTWDSSRNKWRAQIQVDGVVRNLGRFATEQEAALARDTFVTSNATGHELNLHK